MDRETHWSNVVGTGTNPEPLRNKVTSVNGKTGEVNLTADDVGALSNDALQKGVNQALQQAKESGDFDGRDGEDYILTDEDKQEIADLIPVPKGSGIYIGSGDMPEGYDVQIDPEGEPLDLDSFTTDEELEAAIRNALAEFEPPESDGGISEDRVNEMIADAFGGIVNGSY